MTTVHVIHDNPDWLPPFVSAFAEAGVALEEWLLTDGSIDLTQVPPEGVYWSRLSASSFSRGSEHIKDYGRAVLTWLEASGRTVVNGRSVLELEMSKIAQHQALTAAGIGTPRTVAVFGTADLVERANSFDAPFIIKHNQGGKGLNVRRFDDHDSFARAVQAHTLGDPVDGVFLLQDYILATDAFITRAEFVDRTFVYAVRVDTSAGNFELCPADACSVPVAMPLFSLRDGVAAMPIIAQLQDFLEMQGIGIAGVEFIETADGRVLVYDVNTNTNYNPDVEAAAVKSGPGEIAAYLKRLADQD